ncbi:hypothetical protein [Photobacterium damselae]|uniref:hypothetical protein n=1 Tax=Photobacterium damselae TaxID=38293 RepID=UPI00165DB6AF|nr:hypothetical protein [Photobacterium damselae]
MSKFKRLRAHKGSTLKFEIPLSPLRLNSFRRVVRAEIKKNDGAPVARFQTAYDAMNITCVLNPTDTIRLSGQYKYEIGCEDMNGIHTVQYGVLEVL